MGTLENTVLWAAKNGFGSLEVHAAPGAAAEPSKVEANVAAYRKLLKENDVIISSLGFYENHLDPDLEARRRRSEHFKKVIDLCPKLDVGIVTCLAGRFSVNQDENFAEYEKVFGPLSDYAGAHGVRVAFEIWPGGNFASTPDTWERLFKVLPSKTLGLNFDPSHLVWQFVDYVEAVRKFGERIYTVHAKDTEIIQSRLAYTGFYGPGWWRYRLPGWGMVNWPAFISVLKDVKYDFVLTVEHEDPLFALEDGLVKSRRFLSNLIG